MVFVVGSPRSGTTFVGNSLGSQPGFVDLGEVPLLKAAVPRLVGRPVEEQAREVRRLVQLVRNLGLVHGLRGVEQNPETSYVLRGALLAYPAAKAVHVIRDGRDVVCSLLERGWLGAGRRGQRRREPGVRRICAVLGRAGAAATSSRRRARRRAPPGRGARTSPRRGPPRSGRSTCATSRSSPTLTGEADADRAGARRGPGAARGRVRRRCTPKSVGRWRKDLTPEQLADVEAEAGALLAELGYI